MEIKSRLSTPKQLKLPFVYAPSCGLLSAQALYHLQGLYVACGCGALEMEYVGK